MWNFQITDYISQNLSFLLTQKIDWNVKKYYKKSNKYIKSEIVQKYMFKVELFDKHCFTQALPPWAVSAC